MKYIKREMADMNGTGTTPAYYKILSYGCIDFDELIDSCARHGSLPRGVLVGALTSIVNELAMKIADGHTVKIDGLGTFGAKLGVRPDKDYDTFDEGTEKRNARSLKVTGVSFRADKQLVSAIDGYCLNMERAGVSRLRTSKYSQEERVAMARAYLKANAVMRVSDYMELTDLSRTAATNELNMLSRTPGSGIEARGRHSTKVFILAESVGE